MITEMETEKYCPGCKTPKPLGEFCKNRSRKDGLSNRCRGCKGQYQAEYQTTERGREFGHRTNRRYRATLKGRLGNIFHGMDRRCTDPNYIHYKYYGGRGIQNKFGPLDEFRAYVRDDLGITILEQIEGLQIDRIDNDGHYEPGNIRFVTREVNINNRSPRKIGGIGLN